MASGEGGWKEIYRANNIVSNAQENASGLRWAVAALVVTPVWKQTELFHSCFSVTATNLPELASTPAFPSALLLVP